MRRCGNAAATRWISPQVLSLEWPSTKISSVPAPSSGVRSTAAWMLPASLRAGIMTETVSGRGGQVTPRAGDEKNSQAEGWQQWREQAVEKFLQNPQLQRQKQAGLHSAFPSRPAAGD